jgi:hypothetical protein
MTPTIEHCLIKVFEIVAKGDGGRRSVFQLGYNLGRLSELSGLGRAVCWDPWKDVVIAWDRPRLARLAQELRIDVEAASPPAP